MWRSRVTTTQPDAAARGTQSGSFAPGGIGHGGPGDAVHADTAGIAGIGHVGADGDEQLREAQEIRV